MRRTESAPNGARRRSGSRSAWFLLPLALLVLLSVRPAAAWAEQAPSPAPKPDPPAAEEDFEDDMFLFEAEELVVTGVIAPAPPLLPGVVVVAAERARERGARTVADALERSAGVAIQRSGSRYEPLTVRLRGSTGEQVLVLIDGRRVTDGVSGLVDLSRLPLDQVERIEVYYGPATARFGVGGAAGAINIITVPPQRARELQWSGSSRYSVGSFGDHRLALALERADAEGSLSAQATGGFAINSYSYERAGATEVRANAGGAEGSARMTAVRRRFDEAGGLINLTAALELSKAERGTPGSIEFPSTTGRLGDAALSGRVGLERAGPTGWEVGGELSGTLRERTFVDTALPSPQDSARTILSVAGLRLNAARYGELFLLGATAETTTEILRDAALGDRFRVTGAIAPRAELTGNVWDGEASARVEVVYAGDDGARADSGTATTGATSTTTAGMTPWQLLPSARVGVGRRFGADSVAPLRLAVTGAAGYRLPTFAELFWPAGPFALGNRALRSERSLGGEIEALLGVAAGSHLRASGFWTEYEDLIQWQPGPDLRWRPRNSGRARAVGVEVGAQWVAALEETPWTLTVSGETTVNTVQDLNPGVTFGKQLPYRARILGAAGITVRHGEGAAADLSTRWVGARPLTAQNTVWLDPFVTLDASVRVPLRTPWLRNPILLTGTVHNLFDDRFVETRFQPNPGREVVLAVEVRW